MVVKVKKGDCVVVFIGCNKGVEGEVLKVILVENCVVVCGVNVVKCYIKLSQLNLQGGINLFEVLIYVLNVVMIDLWDGKVIWVGFKIDEYGCKFCYVKCLGEVFDV